MFKLNKDQQKHLASVIDKVGIAYFAVVGYTAYSAKDWMTFVHAGFVFVVIQIVGVLVLKDPSGSAECEGKEKRSD